jgi:hypothetical protein
MKNYNVDIPVLILFWARPEPLTKVFEQVKLAKPSKLYLYQDGPRNDKDLINIEKCQQIVSEIDWECEVHRLYQKENYGCDPSEYMAQKWMFATEEYGIVLEDDDVPSQSFFPYCKELLETYKHDTRIGLICGMNNLGEFDSPYSYTFAKTGSIWGWATWKRNVDLWDETYTWLDDSYSLNKLKQTLSKNEYNNLIKTALRHRESGKAHYESICGSSGLLNSQLNIIPAKNMISNIGITADSTHAVDSLSKLPKGLRRVFFMKTNEIELPLTHPKYVQEDIEYKKKLDRLMGFGHPLVALYRRIESRLYRVLSK